MFDVSSFKLQAWRMLIICSGADSYRALHRAEELERAFKEKYDPMGLGIEHLASGKGAIESILEKASVYSLFSPRCFFRVRGLLEDIPKTKHKAFVQALERDPERVIIVSIEDEAPSKTVLKSLDGVKIVSYDFPVLEGKDWLDWVAQEAGRKGIQDMTWIRLLAQAALGDSWYVQSELAKAQAAGLSPISSTASPAGAFERADRFLMDSPRRYADFGAADELESFNNKILSSMRSAIRVRDGAVEGLHPYVRQKLSRMSGTHWNKLFSMSVVSLVSTRTGLCRDEESLTLLP